jgi:hypothetical protein
MTALWDIAPCGIIEQIDISEMRTAYIISLIMAAILTSEISVYFNEIIRTTPQEAVIFKLIPFAGRK